MSLEGEKRLLLHICCSVCASRIIERLEPGFTIIGFFYNPNIEPPQEYQQRLKSAVTLANHCSMKLINGIYDNKMWHESITGLEHWEEGGRRCWRCFRIRLEKTAEQAKNENINNFATTLSASPHKNIKVINNLGHKIGKVYGINFIEFNFRYDADKYRLSLAKKLGLYHQKYCGCIYSAPL